MKNGKKGKETKTVAPVAPPVEEPTFKVEVEFNRLEYAGLVACAHVDADGNVPAYVRKWMRQGMACYLPEIAEEIVKGVK